MISYADRLPGDRPTSVSGERRSSLSTRERQSKSVALRRSLEERTNQQYAPQELLFFLLKTFFPPCPFPAPQALKNMAQPTRAEVLRVLYWKPALLFGCREAPAAPQGQCRRHPLHAGKLHAGKFFEVGPEGFDLGVRKGVRAEKWLFVGHFGTPRSRQDASIECHVGGSIRPSLGCNGVHVVCLKPLFRRSLRQVRSSENAVLGGVEARC